MNLFVASGHHGEQVLTGNCSNNLQVLSVGGYVKQEQQLYLYQLQALQALLHQK